MDTLKDLLSRRDDAPPPEMEAIKGYIKKQFNSDVSVKVLEKQIVIMAPSAALAGTLRLHSVQIAKVCQTDKKLVFKIGS